MEHKVPIAPVLTMYLSLFAVNGYCGDKGWVPENGFVPDSSTAVRIAEAVWLPIYGAKIFEQKPFVAKLVNGTVWEVSGTLHTDKGGTAYAEIGKTDACIIKVTHGK